MPSARPAASAVPVGDARTLVGVAGSVTTVAAMALRLTEYDPSALHGAVVTLAQVEQVTAELLTMTKAERAALPFMHEGRVEDGVGDSGAGARHRADPTAQPVIGHAPVV